METECLVNITIEKEQPQTSTDDTIVEDYDNSSSQQYDYDHENPPLDDWFDYDNEARVDHWIGHCQWNHMSRMKESDTDEIPPRPVHYCSNNKNNNNNNNGDDNNNNRPGKILHVPAWISNALFPYQRTGLQWMWEFFCNNVMQQVRIL